VVKSANPTDRLWTLTPGLDLSEVGRTAVGPPLTLEDITPLGKGQAAKEGKDPPEPTKPKGRSGARWGSAG
jgi:hypothetical protein